MIFLKLFLTFFEIGLFTFGGGYAMLPLIMAKVEEAGWLSEQDLINFVAVSESTPGPFAVNISTYVGMETGGIFGAFCATFGVVLPSFVIILIVAGCFERFKKSSVVMGVMSGLKPAVVGMILATLITVSQSTFFADGLPKLTVEMQKTVASVLIFALMVFLSIKKKHPILIIALSACLGIGCGYLFGW